MDYRGKPSWLQVKVRVRPLCLWHKSAAAAAVVAACGAIEVLYAYA